MTNIAGVKVNKSKAGKTTHVTIDVRKNPQAYELLKEAGLLPKTSLQKEAEEGITVEELRAEIHELLTEHYAKRHH